MTQYNFEGDLDNINERQLEFINKVIQEQDLGVTKVVFSPVGKAGDNFVANVKRINIEGDNGSLKMIAKIASMHEVIRKTSHTEISFANEHAMYTEVLPKLVQLQKDAGVPEEGHLPFAKCYGSLNEVPNEVVLLEDLNESNFIMLNKFESLSNDCVRSILKNLAILHSLSFVLKEKEPETYDLFRSKLTDLWVIMADDTTMVSCMPLFETDILLMFDKEADKSLIRNKLTDAFKLAVYFSKNIDNRYSVIQQGDAWTNNMMFKFEGNDLAQSIMIDYQGSRNNSPVVDLYYMIFNCTDYETRSKHYYDWLNYYHSELDNSLGNFGLKVSVVYPREQLDADMKKYSSLLFGFSLLISNLLARDSAEASEFMEARKNPADLVEIFETRTIDAMPEGTKTRFKKKIQGLFDSFTEFGLL